jgi:hypothetical protein
VSRVTLLLGSPRWPRSSLAGRRARGDEDRAREVERGDQLESQIEAELQRQEQLLEQMRAEEAARKSAAGSARQAPPRPRRDIASAADPRIAPAAPQERELPLEIFDKRRRRSRPAPGQRARLAVVRVQPRLPTRTAARADPLLRPRERRAAARTSSIRDYNGKLDCLAGLPNGALVRRVLDENGDGKPDAWEQYRDGRMTSREVDRNHDGKRDATYTYAADSLVQEQHDGERRRRGRPGREVREPRAARRSRKIATTTRAWTSGRTSRCAATRSCRR